jgi:hypothetical protein
MIENGSHAFVHGVDMVDLKLTSGKIIQLKNVQHVPSINKNLVSGSLLCRDDFKVVVESNKFVVSKCGQFIDKGYVCGGLFCFQFLISVMSLWTIFVMVLMRVMLAFGIHVYVISILVLCLNCPV